MGSERKGMSLDYRGQASRRYSSVFRIMKIKPAIWNFLVLVRHCRR
jgi:hypothetical protein